MGAAQLTKKGLGTCVWKLRGWRGVERRRWESVDVMSCLQSVQRGIVILIWSLNHLCAGVDVLLSGGNHPEWSWSPAHCALWAAGPVLVSAILAQPFSLPSCLLFPGFSGLLSVYHSINVRSMFSPASLAVTSMPSVTAQYYRLLLCWKPFRLFLFSLNWTTVSCSLFVCWQ